MEPLIIFTKRPETRDGIKKIRSTIGKDCTIFLCEDIEGFEQVCRKQTIGLVIVELDKFYVPEKLLIKRIQRLLPNVYLALVSNREFAFDAWKIEVDAFFLYPLNQDRFSRLLKQYLVTTSEVKSPTLLIKQVDQTVKVPVDEIKYLKAQANYTYIYYGNSKSILTSRQLGKYSFLCEQYKGFTRLHRSLIFNLENVVAVKGNAVYFKFDKEATEVSKSMAIKVKKALINEL